MRGPVEIAGLTSSMEPGPNYPLSCGLLIFFSPPSVVGIQLNRRCNWENAAVGPNHDIQQHFLQKSTNYQPFFIFFQQRYGHNPITLYHMVQHCLHQEMNLVQKADLVRQLFFVNQETGPVLTFALLQMASDISSSAASPLHDSGGGGGTPSGVAAITPAVGLSSTSAHCNSEAAYQVRTFAKKSPES